MPGLGARELVNALTSHAQSLGIFDLVNAYEPKSGPKTGLGCYVWVDEMRPVPSSGLASTSVRIVFSVRIYTILNFVPRPHETVEIIDAADKLMAAYSGDFNLNGLVRAVDLLGQPGSEGLIARAGYVEMDKTMYQVMTISVPIIVNDVWDQVA